MRQRFTQYTGSDSSGEWALSNLQMAKWKGGIPEMMALGIPAEMAVHMVENLDASIIIRRPQMAFPRHVAR